MRSAYVDGPAGIRVPMREVALAPTSSLGGQVEGNAPVRIYDTSGPYTDPEVTIVVSRTTCAKVSEMLGLPKSRLYVSIFGSDWINFVREAKKRGMVGLKGHRSVGGIRVSLYNAVEPAWVDALCSFMQEFTKRG